jgi:hypothetical protein
MNREHARPGNRGTLFMALLTLVTAMNTSQAAVLCIGPNGHVAIEAAGHEHCGHASHADDHDADARYGGLTSHVRDSHCRPCTDIPISAGACGEQMTPGTSKIPSAGSLAQLSLSQTPEQDGAPGAVLASPASFTSYFIPLRSVVLQV